MKKYYVSRIKYDYNIYDETGVQQYSWLYKHSIIDTYQVIYMDKYLYKVKYKQSFITPGFMILL